MYLIVLPGHQVKYLMTISIEIIIGSSEVFICAPGVVYATGKRCFDAQSFVDIQVPLARFRKRTRRHTPRR